MHALSLTHRLMEGHELAYEEGSWHNHSKYNLNHESGDGGLSQTMS